MLPQAGSVTGAMDVTWAAENAFAIPPVKTERSVLPVAGASAQKM